jgi:hypothetical protein
MLQVVTKAEMGGSAAEVRRFGLKTVPMALTCGLYSGHLIADPTSEEETLAASLVSTIVDASGCIVGEPFYLLSSFCPLVCMKCCFAAEVLKHGMILMNGSLHIMPCNASFLTLTMHFRSLQGGRQRYGR